MFKSITALSASLIIAQVVSVINQLIIGRYYAPDLLGAYSMAIHISFVFSIFFFLRSEYFVVEIEKSKVAQYFINRTFFKRLPYGFSAIILVLLINIVYPFTTYESIIFAILFSVITSYNTGFQQVLFKQRRYFQSGLTEVVQKFSYGAFLILLSLAQVDLLNAILLSFLVAITLRLVFTKIKLKGSWVMILSKKESLIKSTAELVEKGKTLSKNNVVSAMATLIPTVYITKTFSLSDLGLFSMSITILSIPTTLIGNSISNVLYERLSSKDSYSIGKKQIIGLLLFLMVTSLAFLLIYPLGETVVGYLFDENWANSVKFAQFMLPAMMTSYISKPFERICYIYNRSSWHFKTIKIKLVLVLLAILVFHVSSMTSILDYILLHSLFQTLHFVIDLLYNLRLLRINGNKI